MTTAVKCIVSGRVQGVWFRETTRKKALELGLSGSAVNCRDGTVEVIVCGDHMLIAEFQEWLWVGSPMSKVAGVTCESAEIEPPSSFTTS